MFLGLRTVVYHVADLKAATAWWTELLGFPPYFDQPFYVGFQVGGYELGLHPEDAVAGINSAPGNVITYWGVQDLEAAYQRILALGAKEHQAIQDVGEGIRVAAVVDPSGNIVGLIDNPHFKLPAA